MKTICLDPVTPPLLTTRRLAGARFDPRGGEPFLSFVTVDRPPPAAECDCWQPMTARALGQHSVGCGIFGPSPWIGKRVAIYAKDVNLYPYADRMRTCGITPAKVALDAIVGSGTLAEALRIIGRNDKWDGTGRVIDADHKWLYDETTGGYGLADQWPLQDWSPVAACRTCGGRGWHTAGGHDPTDCGTCYGKSPNRWALRFTDVAPTVPCPNMEHHAEMHGCLRCHGTHEIAAPVLAPVLSGDDPTYREWRV